MLPHRFSSVNSTGAAGKTRYQRESSFCYQELRVKVKGAVCFGLGVFVPGAPSVLKGL